MDIGELTADAKEDEEVLPYVVVSVGTDDNEYLIFGLNWNVVIGPSPNREALGLVRAARATHFVPPGDHSSVVGYVKFTDKGKARFERLSTWYSAAGVFAGTYQKGVHAFIGHVEGDRHWFVACLDGEVITSTDVVYPSLADAIEAFDALKEQYPQLIRVAAFDFHRRTPTSKLVEVKGTISAMPLWLRGLAVAVAVVLLVSKGADVWEQLAKSNVTGQQVEKQIDAASVWKDNLDRWQQTVGLDGPEGLISLLANIGHAPFKVAGWKLSKIDCRPDRAGWHCDGDYIRGAIGTNVSLLLVLPKVFPKGATIKDQQIGKTTISWNFAASRYPLDRSKLGTASELNTSFLSAVQADYAAFKTVSIPSRTNVSVTAPNYTKASGDVVTVPYSDRFPQAARLPGIRTFEFDGPMRSLTVLSEPLPLYASFSKITVTVIEAADPKLAKSIMNANITGAIYVQ